MPRAIVLALLSVPALAGCGFIPLYSYNNEELDEHALTVPRPVQSVYRTLSLRPQLTGAGSAVDKASLVKVPWNVKPACRAARFDPRSAPSAPSDCQDHDFVALAISGGGSRAAVFGAAVMFELQRYGLLDHVDLVSCVSGGCLTAAYYVLSCDHPDDPETCPATTNGAQRYAWREEEIYPLLERRLLWRWFGNWFWPTTILKFWFTHYDRTDIMASTLSNNLYDRSILDNNQFRFRDLNPARPNIAINATNVVPGADGEYHFTFTPEAFREINSDLDHYPIANAVMASASFPGAFNYVTLRDFRHQNYVHLLDGGACDNLGLNAIRTAMRPTVDEQSELDNRVVIVIDAYIALDNGMTKRAEPRGWSDYIVDSNFVIAYDTLLTSLRATQLSLAETLLARYPGTLLHISWENLEKDPDPDVATLGNRLNRIPTSLNITPRNAERLKAAAKILVARKLKEVLCDGSRPADARRIRKLLAPSAPPIACF
jgi:predicted acylesterase/phospholipase RssA